MVLTQIVYDKMVTFKYRKNRTSESEQI